MDPERTKLTAPERVYLGYTSFWYEDNEEGLHDIGYVREDIHETALTTTRLEAVREAQIEAAEFFCHWLLRAYEAIHRDTSYEEGENLDGIAREINQVIGFAGYEPESAAREQLLAKKFSWNELHIEAAAKEGNNQ